MLNSIEFLRSQNLFYGSGSVATFHVYLHLDNSFLLREFANNYSISDSERVAKTDRQSGYADAIKKAQRKAIAVG